MEQDLIVAIPPNRVRFFGTSGKMLLPSPATIAALVARVPEHQVITTDLIRKYLAAQFHVQGTCPVTTKKALLAVARDSRHPVAYWRVLNQNGGLISNFPGGPADQAARLRQEGFTIQMAGKTAKVENFKACLFDLEK